MESNKCPAQPEVEQEGTSNADEKFLSSWKMFKARENFRLKLQMEALKTSLEEQMRVATVLNMIELPPDNMDEDEIFNDRLEYREGELAGNYGQASKEAVEKFFGESKPVFKYAQIPSGKVQRQVIQEIPELYVMSDTEAAVQGLVGTEDVMTQVILLDNQPSLDVGTSDGNETLFQLPNDTLMVFPDPDSLPDLLTMETQVKLAEIDLTDLGLMTEL